MTEDFYDLLEIPSDASQDEIKDAYREQVRVYHPDLNDDDRARAQFTAVKKAYDILGDPVERQAYDRLGHETYVAKRTSGLPSADVWRSNDDSTADSDSGDSTADSDSDDEIDRTRRSTSRSTGTASRSRSTTGGTASASATSGPTDGSTTGSTSRTSSTTSRSSASSSATGTASGNTTATNGGTATAGNQGVGSTGTTRSHNTTGSSSSSTGGRFEDNALITWWRRQNFAWPLIWLSALTYLAGLGHYASENAAGIGTILEELLAIGADPGALWEALSTQRYGIQSPIEFVLGLVTDGGLVTPPVEQTQWYGLLAGIVAAAFGFVLLTRVLWRSETWGRITIDETIVMALAVGVTATVLGGPLLAGAVLMPMLFGVIVYRTRQLPGWSPSLLYVLAVLTPAVGLAGGVGGVDIDSLAIEFVVFVLVPLLGAFGLPVRGTIRKRFGR